MYTKILIVGAGLSGLHTAYECQKKGLDYCLIEARERLGGRVLSLNKNSNQYDAALAAFDLGPSWFWPGQQRMLSLINELNLSASVFNQTGTGGGIYEDNQGNIQRNIDGISMAGAYRLQGGIRQLTEELSSQLDADKVHTSTVVSEVMFENDAINVKVKNNPTFDKISCKYIILAMPPRVALANIIFTPDFNDERKQQLNEIATWMAGHAKLVCVYESKFWQQQGFSGDVISHRGPLQEIHDASSEQDELNALFGFVGVPPVNRRTHTEEIKSLAVAQLTRLFGDHAASPLSVHLQDWAQEQFTATEYDQQIQGFHPTNNIVNVEEPDWSKRLIWSGTESTGHHSQNNGFLEGALEASMQAVSLVSV